MKMMNGLLSTNLNLKQCQMDSRSRERGGGGRAGMELVLDETAVDGAVSAGEAGACGE